MWRDACETGIEGLRKALAGRPRDPMGKRLPRTPQLSLRLRPLPARQLRPRRPNTSMDKAFTFFKSSPGGFTETDPLGGT